MGRVRAYRKRVRREIRATIAEKDSPRTLATSFAVGLFITALPTLGTGLLVMAALVYLFEGLNKIALLASVAVLNPVVKGGVYVASFGLGTRILGPVPIGPEGLSLFAGPDIVLRLIVGNSVLALVFAAVGYVLMNRGVRRARQRVVTDDGRSQGACSE